MKSGGRWDKGLWLAAAITGFLTWTVVSIWMVRLLMAKFFHGEAF